MRLLDDAATSSTQCSETAPSTKPRHPKTLDKNHRDTPGETDLATLRPCLASEWGDYNDIDPDQVTCFSDRVVAWRCVQGHTWRAAIARRSKGAGCPYCPTPRTASTRRQGDSTMACPSPHDAA
ncbi:zinc-ribbon domain-containing protein [Pseudoclavibacter helvolus]|uniref:zinc-ribbon domain-containing protein n=1 Tax=Pseudoclavibacter helvolus TaxID=255205 RepID=UPI003D153C2D